MTRRTSAWPAGTPCWVDLATPDIDASRAFYGELMGWEFTGGDPEFGGYLTCEVDGASAAGMGPQQPGSPVAWTMYFASDDADATAAAVTAGGGTVVAPPMDVGPMGRMLIASDPTGAFFGVWQSGVMLGAGIANEPGSLTWEDLRSGDPDAARDFYAGVFGFEYTPLEGAGPDYTTFSYAGDPAPLGGMGGMMGQEGIPPHWVVYFSVADVDATVQAAARLGGTVLSPGFDTTYGRMAALLDPHGAAFWIADISGNPSPDRGD